MALASTLTGLRAQQRWVSGCAASDRGTTC